MPTRVGGNSYILLLTLLVLNLGLDIVDSVRRLDLKSDGLAREGLDENLHRNVFLSLCTRWENDGNKCREQTAA